MSEQAFGPYRVLDKLGEGGMGVVYRARDTRLERDVALKVLPDVVSGDPDRLARFDREARLLASLNHPHIAQVYGFERDGDRRAIAMELVDGPTLAELIQGEEPSPGGLPLDRAMAIARQIADALEAAHDQGVIHRDLKPANIKVRDDGTVKVLDFGLAKAMTGDEEASGPNAANSPTLTARATELGVILGTAAYMAPEQAKGKRVDKRADVWAFGVVLLEMLTGERAFEGEDVSETLASVLAREPNLSALPASTPAPVRRLIARCLEKDPKKRVRDIGDAMRRLDEDMAAAAAGPVTASDSPPAPGGIGRWLLPAMALIIGAAGGAFLLSGEPTSENAGPVRFTYRPSNPDATIVLSGNQPDVAIAPDGRQVLFRWRSDSGSPSFAVRRLDDPDAVTLRGTEGVNSVFFSPDGDAVGLVVDDNTVARIPVGGGRPQPLGQVDGEIFGATWLEDGRIAVGTRDGELFTLPENGGSAEALTTPGDAAHLWPSVIPGADALLFVENRSGSPLQNGEIMVLDLTSGEVTALGLAGVSPTYAASGHVVYATVDASLWAAPFDAASLSVTGPAAPVVDQVSVGLSGAADFAVSRAGRLVYLADTGSLRRQLVWVDAAGAATPLPAPVRQYSYVWLSPDDTKLSLDVRDEGRDIWVYDITRNTLERRTTTETDDEYGLWSRDGRDLVFSDQKDLYRVPANGTAAPEAITRFDADSLSPFPNAVTGDRRVVFRQVPREADGNDLYIVPLDGSADPELLLGTPDFNELNSALSPDDRWIAYESNQSGSNRYEVYARPFPDLNADLVQVSNAGGRNPVWSRDGTVLFYLDASNWMTRVPFSAANGFGQPVRLFDASRFFTGNVGRNYDVARDGRFIMILPERGNEADRRALSVVINWFDVLREIR